MAKFKPPKVFDYKRTPSTAKLLVEFTNGEAWEVPVQVVADDRDSNYADEQEDTLGFIRAGSLSDYELTDWASNNMNWSDLAAHAVKVRDKKDIDREGEWANAEKTVIGAV